MGWAHMNEGEVYGTVLLCIHFKCPTPFQKCFFLSSSSIQLLINSYLFCCINDDFTLCLLIPVCIAAQNLFFGCKLFI
jgi:hypothetical protein